MIPLIILEYLEKSLKKSVPKIAQQIVPVNPTSVSNKANPIIVVWLSKLGNMYDDIDVIP